MAGLLAAAVGAGAGELGATLLPGARSPLTGLGRTIIDLTPGPAVDVTIALVEERDKTLVAGGLAAGYAASGLAAGRLFASRPFAAVATLAAPGLLAGAAAACRPDSAGRGSLAAAALGPAAGCFALWRLDRAGTPVAAITAAIAIGTGGLARRRAAGRAAARSEARASLPLPRVEHPLVDPPREPRFEIAGLTPPFTPNRDFYETDVSFPAPALDAAAWRLRIDGLVAEPLELTYSGLLELPLVELDATLVCVHNPVGGDRIGTARWVGIPVSSLLSRAAPLAPADQLVAHSVDGFSAAIPLHLSSSALVAVGMNGDPLSFGHGYPARLLVPGIYGYGGNTKWLSRLELTTFARGRDYWERRGWPRGPARVRPGARIDVPADRSVVGCGPAVLAGVAWAPPAGVDAVEVSIDGAWRPAELSAALAPTAWRRWRCDWVADPGRHELIVRIPGGGQTGAPPYPSGADGRHTIRVEASDDDAKRPPRQTDRLAAEVSSRSRLAARGLAAWAAHGPITRRSRATADRMD